jgi:hypothetical protein
MSNGKGILGGLVKMLSKFLKIIELLPVWLRFAGLVALCVFVISFITLIRLDNDNGRIIIALVGIGSLVGIFVIGLRGYRAVEGVDKVKKSMGAVPKGKETIVKILEGAAKSTAKTLKISEDKLRANIFTLTSGADGFLRIPDGFHYHMDNPVELTVRIPPGYGCAGNAFVSKEPTIAIFEKDWGEHTINDVELKKVDKRLVWIISMPIPSPTTSGEMIGVLNVDCLKVRKEEADLERVVSDLWYWVNLLAPLL